MAIQRIGNETRDSTRKLAVERWQQENSSNRCDNGKVRETRAELAGLEQSGETKLIPASEPDLRKFGKEGRAERLALSLTSPTDSPPSFPSGSEVSPTTASATPQTTASAIAIFIRTPSPLVFAKFPRRIFSPPPIQRSNSTRTLPLKKPKPYLRG